MDLRAGIRNSYLGRDLDRQDIDLLVDIAEDVTFTNHEEVFRAGDPSTAIYVLLEGRVQVTTSTGEFIARMRPCEVLGEMALFSESPRSVTIVADGITRLAKFPAQKLKKLVHDNPTVGIHILMTMGKELCMRIRSSNMLVEKLYAAIDDV